MYGELRDFGSGLDMNEHLMQAAAGPVNTVTRKTFEQDASVASSMAGSNGGSAPQVDSTPIKGSGSAPMGNASGAGYNAPKSAYIESNKGGYQARPRAYDVNIPRATAGFAPEAKQSIRLSNYRRNHLKTVTRGLRALS